MRLYAKNEKGSVLVTSIIIAGLIAVVLAAQVKLVGEQNYLAVRSQKWSSAIPLAEAGIEEALAHLNSQPTNLASSGWSLSGTNYVKSRAFMAGSDTNGYYLTSISPGSSPPSVTSIGFGRIPLQSGFVKRTVLVTYKKNSGSYGILAKTTVSMSGGAWMDSYDPTDPSWSTGGKYDPAKQHDQAAIGSLSSLKPAINTGTGKIYGNVSTGPNGTATGNVGDGTWLTSNTGIQPGHFSDTLNVPMPDVTVPFVGIPAVAGTVSGTNYQYVLGNGDYTLAALTISQSGNGQPVIVTGKARLYVVGNVTVSGSGYIWILPGGSLQLYVGGQKCVISGSGVVNGSQAASDCAIFGLPTCTQVTYSGGSSYIGTVYAPQAAFTLSGGTAAYGAFTALSFSCSGSMAIHYDESLGGKASAAQITSWLEL